MVACGRRCCICHKFCGNNMDVHHIRARADGGTDTYDNAIPLCFDCHAEVRQYDPKHPKGIRFTEKELIQHRDNWYKTIASNGEKEATTKHCHSLRPAKRLPVLQQVRSRSARKKFLRISERLCCVKKNRRTLLRMRSEYVVSARRNRMKKIICTHRFGRLYKKCR